MKTTRRDVLRGAAVGAGATALAACGEGGGKGVVDAREVAGCEALMDVTYTASERAQIVDSYEDDLDTLRALRAADFENFEAPAHAFDPRLPGESYDGPGASRAVPGATPPVVQDESEIAFAGAVALGRAIQAGELTSEAVTRLYLDRIVRFDPQLRAIVSVMEERALVQARTADGEIAQGRIRGPLHGVPYVAKDLFDAEGALTTWGAAPYRTREGRGDAAVIRKLSEAGAVILAKSTLGALAYGDIWWGGETRNPWNVEEGSSGSSAGSASCTAAGLCGFSLGTETLGSIVSPSTRCGTVGLRPTFGRVSRQGAMALCWSLDKIGPITRTVEDAGVILGVLNGYDPADAGSLDVGFSYDGNAAPGRLRIGVDEAWFEEASDAERAALSAAKNLFEVAPVSFAALPYGSLIPQLLAEAAAAFEEMTLSNADDQLRWQEPEAWPNSFRKVRFLSAVDLIQIDRLRRRTMRAVHDLFDGVDAVLSPNYAAGLLVATNYAGTPSLTLRAGYVDSPARRPSTLPPLPEDTPPMTVPIGVTLWGPLFGEAKLLHIGKALEARLGVQGDRPPLFA